MYQVQIKGFAEFNKNLNKAPKQLEDNLDTAIKKSIATISRNAKLKTPVRTGQLVKGYRTKFGSLEGVLANIVKYAPYVEYGTRSFTGRFFLAKGMQNSVSSIQKFFEKALNDVMVKITKI